MPSDFDPSPSQGVSENERRRVVAAGWPRGGAPNLLRTYSDLLTNTESNDSIAS